MRLSLMAIRSEKRVKLNCRGKSGITEIVHEFNLCGLKDLEWRK